VCPRFAFVERTAGAAGIGELRISRNSEIRVGGQELVVRAVVEIAWCAGRWREAAGVVRRGGVRRAILRA
jgi:hypothetical protein